MIFNILDIILKGGDGVNKPGVQGNPGIIPTVAFRSRSRAFSS